MERVYYSINEASARTAHQMMSFSDYKEGSKTAEYKGYVDRAYELADKITSARPDHEDRVYSMAARYSKKMAEYMNRDIHIGCMCPSIMVSRSPEKAAAIRFMALRLFLLSRKAISKAFTVF